MMVVVMVPVSVGGALPQFGGAVDPVLGGVGEEISLFLTIEVYAEGRSDEHDTGDTHYQEKNQKFHTFSLLFENKSGAKLRKIS